MNNTENLKIISLLIDSFTLKNIVSTCHLLSYNTCHIGGFYLEPCSA